MNSVNLVTRLNNVFAAIGVWSLRHRWPVFLLSLALLAAGLVLSGSVRMNNSFDAYFDVSDPSYAAYREYRDDFGSDEVAFLLYDASHLPDGVFDLGLMRRIATLTQRIEREVPFVREVDSITNAELIVPDGDVIEVIELEQDFPADRDTLQRFAKRFMARELNIDTFVTADRKYGMIRVEMAKSSVDPLDEIRLDPEGGDGLENVYPQPADTALKQLLAEEEFRDIRFHLVGDVPLNAAYNRIITHDMGVSMGLAYAVIGVLLLLFFRSLLGMVAPLFIALLSLVMTVAFIGLMGWDMDMMFTLLPTLLAAIGTADAIHIISEFRLRYAQTGNRIVAVRETLAHVGAPCLLTSLTTAAGFFALAGSPIKTIAHMGVYSGVAVMIAFFLSITLLTFFLSWGKPQAPEAIARRNSNPLLDRVLAGIAGFTLRFPRQIVAVSLVLMVLAAVGVSRLQVDTNMLQDFSKEVPVRQDSELADRVMGGMGSIIYLFDAGEPDGIKNPAVLKEIERLQQEVNRHSPLVQKTYSIVDLVKEINQHFHGGDPAFHVIPDDPDLVAQYLMFYEMSGGEELRDFVSDDYRRANLEIRTLLVNSSDFARLKSDLDRYIAQNPVQHATAEWTGIGALWIKLLDYITQSQLQGIGLAFVVITVLMCFIFRSVKVGLISMVPNIIPVMMTVGLLGWLGVYLDYMKLLIAPIAIGIAVDDTIHFVTRFQHEFNRCRNYAEAIRASMAGVGRALMITSVVLVCGFLMNCFTQMDSQFWFGMLLSLTIALALVADFLLMPALIMLLKPFGPEGSDAALHKPAS